MKVLTFVLSLTIFCFTTLAAPLKQVQNDVLAPQRTEDAVTDTLNMITEDLKGLDKALDDFWLPRAIDAVPVLENAEKLLKDIRRSMRSVYWASDLGLLSSAAILGPGKQLLNSFA
jgi:hypothetical protein